MSKAKQVVVVSAARTAIGTYGGSLKGFAPTQLASTVIKAAVERAGIEATELDACVLGHVVHTEARDMYLARHASVEAGLAHSSQAFTLNRLCGSGLQAIVSASQQILLGDSKAAVAGGAEVMSRGGYLMPNARWGARMGDTQMVDMMVGGLTDPFESNHMGITAENMATKWNISREQQDAAAVESHRRASAAWDAGVFDSQIVPIELRSRKGSHFFTRDEHVRADATVEGMAKLRPVFNKEGSVTAGNASGINDAAAALVLMDADEAERLGLEPMARMLGYALAGVDPNYMGIGPVPAVEKLMQKTGLSIDDMDVIELNEAFAVQAMACVQDLKADPAKVNPNGSGISLGHPIGATGAVLAVKTVYELQRIKGRYGLVSMCIGGGQGIAAVFERV